MNTSVWGYKGYPILPLTPQLKLLLALAIIWTLIWKGIALWKAARGSHKAWFVVLLLVNTLGILDILYIYWFSKSRSTPQM